MRRSTQLAAFLSLALGFGIFNTSVFAAQTISYENAENAFKLDTLSYTMAPGNLYDFKVTLKGILTQDNVQVSDSRTGSVIKLSRIAGTDKYRIQAVKEGTSYVVAQVGEAHLSFTVKVKKGVTQSGKASHSNYAVVSAPAPKPETGAITFGYNGSNYGAKSKAELDYIRDKANAAKGSDKYASTYSRWTDATDEEWSMYLGVARSETWLDIGALTSYVSSGGYGQGSAGSAYNYFTGKNRMCGDIAKATQAVLQANGYDAKLAWGTRHGVAHQWPMVKVGGKWYHLEGIGGYGTSVPSGYKMNGSGYNR